MTTQTINKFVKELKSLPEDKINSLFDYMHFLKKQKVSDKQRNNPNQETLKAINDVEQRKNLTKSKNAQDMFKKLGI